MSDVSCPTWAVSADYDYTQSMTAVVKVDLAAQYPDKAADFVIDSNDVIAAFIDNDCVGIGAWKEESGAYWLYIAGPSSLQEGEKDGLVTLRYYSAHYKNLFEAIDAFPYINDTQQGTVAEPFIPAFVVVQ